MVIIDAKDAIVGRLATKAAKLALEGVQVDVINCDTACYSGTEKNVLAKFKQLADRTVPLQGPYFPKQSDRIVRRSIRGMIPYKQAKGKQAFARVKCYVGVPAEFEGKQVTAIKGIAKSKLPLSKSVTVGRIAQHLGGRR